MAPLPGPFTVHVLFVDGAEEIAIGDPTVTGNNLHVKTGEGSVLHFEACYPLDHVRAWWCDYKTPARKNARGRRCPVATPDTAS